MQWEKELLTLREAATLVFKTDLTIRRLIKSGKLTASKENGAYMVKRSDLLNFYGKEGIQSGSESVVKNDQSMPSLNDALDKVALIMWNTIQYWKNEYENSQRLLTESRESAERRKEEIEKRIAKKDFVIKCLIIVLIVWAVFSIVLYLVLSGKVILRF